MTTKRLLLALVLMGCSDAPTPLRFDQEKEQIKVVFEDSSRGVVCYAPMRSVERRWDYPFSCVKVK